MTVSHELRTPLTAIRGHVEAMREGLADDPEARADVARRHRAEAERLERLVGDVLDLAKLDAHRFTVLREEVDMGRLLDQAYASFGEEARRRGSTTGCEHRRRSPVIVTDGDRVLQIISNLLSNAFRWTPDGGRVELACRRENGAVSVDGRRHRARDRPEERERIFRPFCVARRRRHRSRPGDRAGARPRARRPDRARQRAAAKAAASSSFFRLRLRRARPVYASAAWRSSRSSSSRSPAAARGGARCAAAEAVDEEPARLRRHRLRGASSATAALGRGARRVRRLLRRLQRRVPRQRRSRRRARPAPPGQTLRPIARGELGERAALSSRSCSWRPR